MRLKRDLSRVILLIVPVRDPIQKRCLAYGIGSGITGIRSLSNGMYTIAILELNSRPPSSLLSTIPPSTPGASVIEASVYRF